MDLALRLHGVVANQHGPYVRTGLGDHKHADSRDNLGPQDHGDVEAKAQHNGEPHPAESLVVVLLGAAVEQHDDHQAHDGKRYVAQDALLEKR